jgi:hypothetical protein
MCRQHQWQLTLGPITLFHCPPLAGFLPVGKPQNSVTPHSFEPICPFRGPRAQIRRPEHARQSPSIIQHGCFHDAALCKQPGEDEEGTRQQTADWACLRRPRAHGALPVVCPHRPPRPVPAPRPQDAAGWWCAGPRSSSGPWQRWTAARTSCTSLARARCSTWMAACPGALLA